MRDSAAASIQNYLEQAVERLELDDLDEKDLEKVLEKIEKANERIEKHLEDE